MNKYEQEINRTTAINSYIGKNVRTFNITAQDGTYLAFAEAIKNRQGVESGELRAAEPLTDDIEAARLYTYSAAKLQRHIDSIILMEEDLKNKDL